MKDYIDTGTGRGTMTQGHAERIALLQSLLEFCHKNNWDDTTPLISDKLDATLRTTGYSPFARRQYRADIINILAQERISGKKVELA